MNNNDIAEKKQGSSINWGDIYKRLEKSRIAIEQGFQPSEEEERAVLKARAKLLAREDNKEEAVEELIEVLEFKLADERYAIESIYIREVLPLKEFTPVSCTPSFVFGVINVRGQILSVIDLGKLFDIPENDASQLRKIIVIHSDYMEFGILSDEIMGTKDILTGTFQPSLPTLTGIREEFLKGVTPDGLVILDGGMLLEDKNIVVHEEVDI